MQPSITPQVDHHQQDSVRIVFDEGFFCNTNATIDHTTSGSSALRFCSMIVFDKTKGYRSGKIM